MNKKTLIDHRTYNITPRCMPAFLDVFQKMAMPILMKTLGTPVGMYTTVVGPQNQFVHLWAYDNFADYEARCFARDTHPDFAAYLVASKEFIVSQDTKLVRAVPNLLPFIATGTRL